MPLRETDVEILAHPVDRESELELVVGHRRPAVLHLPGLRGAFRDDVEHELGVEPGALREIQCLGESLHDPGDTDLIGHLRELAGADRTEKGDGTRVRIDDVPASIEFGLAAPDHDREHPVQGACFAAGHRCIHESETALRRHRRELLRDVGRRGRVVDEYRAAAHPLESAARTHRHRAHVVVVADAREHDLVSGRGLGRCRRPLPFELLGPPSGFRFRPVVDGDVMARLREMPCHVVAHDSEAEERNLPRRGVR